MQLFKVWVEGKLNSAKSIEAKDQLEAMHSYYKTYKHQLVEPTLCSESNDRTLYMKKAYMPTFRVIFESIPGVVVQVKAWNEKEAQDKVLDELRVRAEKCD